jgi:hypothetical protein
LESFKFDYIILSINREVIFTHIGLFEKGIVLGMIVLLFWTSFTPIMSGDLVKKGNFVGDRNERMGEGRATHTVLGEFGTATWGGFPIYAHTALKELYSEGFYDFVYVSLIFDVNPVANSYVYDYYNLIQFPILWWDGGYDVDLGAIGKEEAKENYTSSIISCLNRDVRDVDIELSVIWLGGTEMQIDYTIHNYEPDPYNGTVKVYITENESSMGWQDAGGANYTMAFLDWAFYENVSIPPGEFYSNTTTWDGESNGYTNVTEENIVIIAAAFNDEWHQGYSAPPSGWPFDAYYADEVVKATPLDNLPPGIPLLSGPNEGSPDKDMEYVISSTDPEDDNVYYWVDWGDGNIDEWIGPYYSGENVYVNHVFENPGMYAITAKSKDEYNRVSDWSEPLNVTINNTPIIQEISGGFGVKATISNNFSIPITDAYWNIKLSGGWIPRGREVNGTIDMPGDSTKDISNKRLFGIGKDVMIIVTAGNDVKYANASWVIGPLVLKVT